ncbi:MAG: NACHT domain-containing protein [Lewinella sp.]|nr:NACHT domain-containing protein [Lewinella sp.]
MKYYIVPTIRQEESSKLIDFLNEDQSASDYRYHLNHISFEELINKDKVFVLGEPGFGKSTLLLEMARHFYTDNTPFAFLDLKRKAAPLPQYLVKHTQEDTSKDQLFNTLKAIWSFGFDLKKTGVLLLDALDEVGMDLIPDLLLELADFIKDYPKIRIFISSRTHHLPRHAPFLSPLDFEAVELSAFSMQQVIFYLQKNCDIFADHNEKEVLTSLQSVSLLKYHSPNNLLYTPRYLEIFSRLVERKGIDEIATYTRNKLLDTIITLRLHGESNKGSGDRQSYNSKIAYVQQCLERLALVMEIQRTNLISKDDFTTFLLGTNLNLDNQLLLEVFFDNTVLKDIGDKLTFDNTEFQEYLAAKALQRIGRIDQTIADVGIDQHLQTILPSWLDVLGYMTELEPACLLPLLQLGKRTRNINVFSLIRYTDLDYFTNDPVQKDQVFRLVFGYFIDECRWLDQELATALPAFYIPEYHDPIFQEIVKSEMDFKGYVRKTSLIFILEQILNLDIPESDKVVWKPILFDYLAFDNFDFGDVLHRYSAKCLEKVASIEDFTPYLSLFDNRPPSVGHAIMEFHRQVDPNHSQSIRIFVDQQLGSRILTISPLTNISSREGFLHLFEILAEYLTKLKIWNHIFDGLDTDLRYPLYREDHLFSRLAKLWDRDIELRVVRFLLIVATDWYYADHSSFVAGVIDLLKKKSVSPVSLILDQIVEQGFPDQKYLELGVLINKLLDLSNYADFHRATQSKLTNLSLAEEVLRSSREEISEKLYQQYFPEKFEAKEIKRAARVKKYEETKNQRWEWETEIYEQFSETLKQRDLRAFQIFRDHKETINKFIVDSEIEKLRSLAKSFLERFSPEECLPSQKRNSISLPPVLAVFQIIIDQLQDLHLDATPFRNKLLKLLPITFYHEPILAALGEDPTYEEIELALNWFLIEINYQSDNELYASLKLILDYNIKFSEPWLMAILQNDAAPLSNRIVAFSKLANWGIEEEQISEVFKHVATSATVDTYRLAKELNQYLLQKENESAVAWRMEQVLKQPYQEHTVKRTTSIVRLAPDSEGLARPLAQLSHPKHIEKMHWFLKQSFSLLDEDPNYYNYVKAEIWEVVAKYFKNLKPQKSQLKTYLGQLRKLVQEYGENNLASWFNYFIASIQNEYLEYLAEPQHFGDSIRKFNQLKERQYLDISYPAELFQLVREVLDNDLRKWLTEGYYGFMGDLEKPKGGKLEKEKIYQKDLVIKLENFLLRKGLRPSDITLHREVQMLDDRRTDLIITYGSIGSVLIEVKRADNTDLSPKQIPIYQEDTFLPYLRQNDCDFGIFLIYNDNPKKKDFPTQIGRVLDCYREDEHRIAVVGIDISGRS